MKQRARNSVSSQPVAAGMTTTTAERYRREAERVRQLANLAASEVTRAELLNIAQQFEDKADALERVERDRK